MTKEIEIKVRVNDVSEVSSWLEKNAQFLRELSQEDVLYDFIPASFILDNKTLKADEFMRIRYTENNDFLTHKIIRRDEKGLFLCCDEKECIIKKENLITICEILSRFHMINITENDCVDGNTLGSFLKNNKFKELLQIRKKRKEYKYDNFNIALDDVYGLGYFIEIEYLKKNADAKEAECIRGEEINLLNNFHLSVKDIVEKGYFDLMVEKI